MFRAVRARLRALLASRATDSELAEELRFHLEAETERNVAKGMSPDAAAEAARRTFGNATSIREEGREAFGWGWLERAGQDAKYAVRSLRRSPGFVVIAVIMLGLGIGLSSAAFSLVNRLVLHPLPFASEERLVLVMLHESRSGISMSPRLHSVGIWQGAAKSFDAISVIGSNRYFLTDSSHTVTTNGNDVSPGLLSMLDVVPVTGRNLLPSDTLEGAPRVAMIGEQLWQREFAGEPGIVGRTVQLNDTAVTIIGVAPAQLNALVLYQPVDLWTPLATSRALTARRSTFRHAVLARMRPGVAMAEGLRELQSLDDRASRDAGESPRSAESPVLKLVRPNDFLGDELHVGLWVVFGATGLLLLIACANVANLQLVRAAHRAGEFAVRRALGASTGRLLRQFLVEGAMLTLLGAVAGVLIGWWALQAVIAARPEQLQQFAVVRFDWPAVAFAVAVAALASLLFCVTPVWRQRGTSLADGLRASGSRTGTARRWLQPAVVSAEIALSLVLLTSAGLLVRSLVQLQRTDPGYSATGLVEFGVTLRRAHYVDSLAREEFWRQFLPRIRAIPGVQGVVVPSSLPSENGLTERVHFEVEGRQMAPGEGHIWFAN